MTREDFDAWRVNPVTAWVFKAIGRACEQERAEWARLSWEGGIANQRVLDQLRDRASALSELIDNDFDIWRDWNGEPADSDDA